jgi:MFS family permease
MADAEGKNGYAWLILCILFFSQVVLALGAYAWGPLGPFIKKSLSLGNVQFGSITSTLYLISVICSIPAGVSVDRWGVKINLIICMLLMGLALILAAFTKSYVYLLALVVFMGASYGMINPIASKGLTLWFDAKTRATAFGIRQMGVTAGGAIAGILLIYLARLKDWNLAVLVVGLLSVVIGVAGLLLYKEAPSNRPDPAAGKQSTPKMTLLDLVKNRNLLTMCLIMALLCLGQSSIGAFLVLYLKEYVGLTAILAGSFLTLTMICGGGARVFWGIVSDRLFNGKRLPVMKIICLLAAVSALSVFLVGSNLSPAFLIPVAALFGFSYLGFQGVAVVLLVEVCGPELAGRATGLGVTIAWMGMVIGPVLFGAIVEAGYQFAWLFVTITSSLSIFLCFTIDE